MLYNLIEFGGVVFWSLVIIDFLFLSYLTSDKGLSAVVCFFCSVGLFYAISNPPIVSWKYCLSYFMIGIAWCVFMFRYRLGKLRSFLRNNPHYITNGEVKFNIPMKYMPPGSDTAPKEIKDIYNTEPSFELFVTRIFCWPMNVLSVIMSDFVNDLYIKISRYLLDYKRRFLAN